LSRRDPKLRSWLTVALGLALVAGIGCWEQVDDGNWFPQMKRQPTFQAFERVPYRDQKQGFVPPEGTVPVGWGDVPELAAMGMTEQDAVQNPQASTFASLERGAELYNRYCTTCHGQDGGGNGPVAGPPFGKGPFGLVLPIGGPMSVAKGLTDGHIYTTISINRGRMPSYQRILPEDRWHIVNYLRQLNGQGGSQ